MVGIIIAGEGIRIILAHFLLLYLSNLFLKKLFFRRGTMGNPLSTSHKVGVRSTNIHLWDYNGYVVDWTPPMLPTSQVVQIEILSADPK